MLLEKRIVAFSKLGEVLRTAGQVAGERSPASIIPAKLAAAIRKASQHNGWFTEENIALSLASLGEMLREDKLRAWIKKYPGAAMEPKPKRIGVIMAGNIPLVGFHDFLCVLMSGHTFVGKLASEDAFLLPEIAAILIETEPAFKKKISLSSTLSTGTTAAFSPWLGNKKGTAAVDCFIATGSNNSARYFEYYFAKHPHIIRKNRNAVAVINGKETAAELANLGNDIFQYYGMGCRNVSKIYIPENYNLDNFFSAIVDFGDVINHNKYYNNYQYYRTIYLLNKEKFLDNNFLLLKTAPSNSPEGEETIASPVATLYYERYGDIKTVRKKFRALHNKIQCIACSGILREGLGAGTVPLGQTQSPELWDYADGVDTMAFLLNIK
jgi:hypothetical protein